VAQQLLHGPDVVARELVGPRPEPPAQAVTGGVDPQPLEVTVDVPADDPARDRPAVAVVPERAAFHPGPLPQHGCNVRASHHPLLRALAHDAELGPPVGRVAHPLPGEGGDLAGPDAGAGLQ